MICRLMYLNESGHAQKCEGDAKNKLLLVSDEYAPIGVNEKDGCVYTADTHTIDWPFIRFDSQVKSVDMEDLREVGLNRFEQ